MSIYNDAAQYLKKNSFDVEMDANLSLLTSFRIGGSCNLSVKPKCFTEVQEAISLFRECGINYYFLGNGSNILVSDKGYNGAIIMLSDYLSSITVSGNLIECETGATLTKLCRVALEHELGGLEFAFGIPGTVGGAIYMNAGAYGGEIKDVIQTCTFIDENNQIKTLSCDELKLAYRHSIFSDTKCCILKATFELEKTSKLVIKEKMDDYITRRKTKQPLEYPSAGSTFKRPDGNYASALIEQCGLKGLRVGDAMVSEKHSGFIINIGKATCHDVLTLVSQIQEIVEKQTGYQLECEIKTLGL